MMNNQNMTAAETRVLRADAARVHAQQDRQPSYEECGGTGSWCATGTHDRTCTCAVAPGHVTTATAAA